MDKIATCRAKAAGNGESPSGGWGHNGADAKGGKAGKAKKRLVKGNSKNEKDGSAMLAQQKSGGAERGNPHHN